MSVCKLHPYLLYSSYPPVIMKYMSIIVATCQLPDVQNNLDKTSEKISQYLKKAVDQNVAILCFPECYLQGYTRDAPTARKRAMSLSLDDEKFIQLLSLTKGFEVTAIISLIEKSENHLFNTAAVIQNGKFLGKFQKAHPHEGIFKAGTTSPVFKNDDITFSVNICNDANYPEAANKLVAAGAKAVFYPLNNRLKTSVAEIWKDKHLQNLEERAIQTQSWVISSDVVYKDGDDIGYGFTYIVDPKGNVVDRALELSEQMITASI